MSHTCLTVVSLCALSVVCVNVSSVHNFDTNFCLRQRQSSMEIIGYVVTSDMIGMSRGSASAAAAAAAASAVPANDHNLAERR